MCLKGIKSTVLFHLFIIFHMACDRGMKCSTSLSVEQLHNSSADSLHHYGNQSETLSFCQAKRSRRPSPCHCQWWLNIGAFFSLVSVKSDPCDPGLSLSPGRSVMAEPDYLEGDCDELIKPKKLINPVKTSRNHQDLHRELLMNQKRLGDRKMHLRYLFPFVSLHVFLSK